MPTDPPADPERARQRLERLSVLLDSCIAVPGTRWRIGIEPLLGLVPGIGDVAGLVIGGVFVLEGWRLGAPRTLLLRMAGNAALDAAVGAVPVLGDLFDFAFKAHRRNAELLGEWLDRRAGRVPPPGRLPEVAPPPVWLLAALAVAAAVSWLALRS